MTESDSHKFTRVLEYLSGTSELGVVLGGDENGSIKLSCYADASLGVHVDGKSQGGTFVSLG